MNLPKPSLAGAAGGGWRREAIVSISGPDVLAEMVLICRCPAGAFLAANLAHEPPLAAVLSALIVG